MPKENKPKESTTRFQVINMIYRYGVMLLHVHSVCTCRLCSTLHF